MKASELQLRVVRQAVEALDIASFELMRDDGAALPAFSAGSHLDVHLPNGLIRQYSLCNDPGESHRYLIGVLRAAKRRNGRCEATSSSAPSPRAPASAITGRRSTTGTVCSRAC